jgi:outer membrane protein OmpA-like peptidoglycan-associated protein
MKLRFPTSALLLLVAALAASTATADAQVWDRAKKAVEDETADQVDRMLRDAVRCAFDDLECIERAEEDGETVVLTDEDGEVLEDEDGEPITDRGQLPPGKRGETAAPAGDADAGFDFEAGTRTIFAADFASDNLGDFPRNLEFIEGNLEVVDWNGSRWLRARSSSAFSISLGEELPERFTVEFDLHVPGSITNGVSIMTTDESRLSGHYYEHNYFRIGHRHVTGVVAGGRSDGAPTSTSEADAMHDGVATARIMVDGSYAKVYVDRTRVANVPNADLPRDDRLWFFVPGSEEAPTYIGALRVAAGGKDLYDALSTEGRVAVQGIHFDTNSATIRPTSAGVLEEIAAMLAERPELALLVEGHTDDEGGFQHNMELSRQRAAAVKAYLVREHGLDAARLETIGLGPTQPVTGNDTEDGRAENRRVELVRIETEG